MTKLMLIAGVFAMLSAGACVDGTASAPPSESVGRTVANTENITPRTDLALPATVDQVFDARAKLQADRVEVCDLQPQDGPCALACDPDALAEQYVPEGTCVLFLCETPSGEPANIGVCNQP